MGVKERKQREREQRRREILVAARQLLMQEGLAALTMDRVAELTELAKGTLYLHVDSRADLLGWLVLDFQTELSQVLEEAAQSRPLALEALEQVGRRYRSFMQEGHALAPLLEVARTSQFHQGLAPELRQRLGEEGMRPFALMSRLVVQAQQEGRVRADQDPLELAMALASASMGMQQLCGGLEHGLLPVSPEHLLERIWALILRAAVVGEEVVDKGNSPAA